MLGHPPPREDERLALLGRPDESGEEMLTWLLAAAPICAAAAPLAGQGHPIASPRFRARRHGETPCGHGPDLGSLVAPEHEAPARTTGYTGFAQGHNLLGPGPRVLAHRWGVSARPTPWRSAPGGEKAPAQRERKGFERRKGFAEGETRRAVRRSLAELSERPLGGRLPVLHCCPFARFPVQVC